MNYRKEIDGLRAIAVVPVILFHAGFTTFSGGFVGVDVFFVISGFLITSIILQEMEAGNFSLLSFYERRARRILPALFLVMVFCITFAWFCLLPNDMNRFSGSVIAVSTFVSNIFFWHESGYFDTSGELKPLLHTWSLAVEEQYYMFFPLLIILTWRFGKKWMIGFLLVLAILSIVITEWGAYNKPNFTFYFLPTRGWELLIGAFLAFYNIKQYRVPFSYSISQSGSLVGLFLIIYSILTFNKSTPFPSAYTLVPTLGTALIILFATPKTIVCKLLSNRIFVGIGLISYSIYLWHQPLFAFARYTSSTGSPSKLVFALLSFVAIVLAYLSWRFLEIPLRKKNIVSTKIFAFSAVICVSFFISFGVLGHRSDGYPNRYPELKSYLKDSQWPESYNRDEECIKKYGGDQYSRITNINTNPTDILIGDSHANHFFFGLSEYLKKKERNLLMLGAGGCPPFFDIDLPKQPDRANLDCQNRTKKMYESVLSISTIHTVFIAFHHSAYFRKDIPLIDTKREILETDQRQFVESALLRTIKEIENAGKTVVILYDLPDLNEREPVKSILEHSDRPKDNGIFNQSMFLKDFNQYDSLLDKVAQKTNARIFYTHRYLKYFPQSKNGDWLYRDNTHLSYKGSIFFEDKYDF